jgi:hypothetical protein
MEPEELSELELTTVEDWEPTVGREESRRPGTEESESVRAGSIGTPSSSGEK